MTEKLRRVQDVPPEELKQICAQKLALYDYLPKPAREALAAAPWGMNDNLLRVLAQMQYEGQPPAAMVTCIKGFTDSVSAQFYEKKIYPRPPAKGAPHVDRAAAYVPRPLPEESRGEEGTSDSAPASDRDPDPRP